MTRPRLTIGMAHHEDFYGLWSTLQSLAFHHPVEDVEFVVVENSPPGEHRDEARKLVEGSMGFGTAGAVYLEMPQSSGTTRTRQAIFDVASSDNVLVMDCHVLVAPDSIRRLKDWFDSNPTTRAILSGPMAYDDRHNVTTHFHNEWSGQMWGIWGRAWRCRCGSLFSIFQREERAVYCTLELEHREIEKCACGNVFPELAWAGHEQPLMAAGFRIAAAELDDPPFEIPGMGMGLFAARKSDWPGFVPEAAGFGGEELCVHEAMRQVGGKTLCLPFLRWLHRFPRPGGPRYTLLVESKVRNYVLWFNRLGRPLDEIHRHFVLDNPCITQEAWNRLVADPVGFTDGIPGAAPIASDSPGQLVVNDNPESGAQAPESAGASLLNGAAPTRRSSPRTTVDHPPYRPRDGEGAPLNVLCLAPTYGRPRHILENTIACFEAQSYPVGNRRLMLFDDGGNLAEEEGDGWRIFSLPTRFASMPAKYNAMLAAAEKWWPEWDAVCVWDDDDVYLPHHVEVNALTLADHRWSYPVEVFTTFGATPGGSLSREETAGRFHGSIAIRRDLIEEIGGWLATDRADYDQQQIAACRWLGGEPGTPDSLRGNSYVFRWADTEASHAQQQMLAADDEGWYERNARSDLESISNLRARFDESAKWCLRAADVQDVPAAEPAEEDLPPMR